MSRIIAGLFFIVSSLSFATALRCNWVYSLQADPFIVVTDKADILETTQATFMQTTDVEGRYPVLLGDYEIKKEKASLTLTFAKAGKVNWAEVDECYVDHGGLHEVQNLRKNNTDTKGDYLAEYIVYPRFLIRPGREGKCQLPQIEAQVATPVYCSKFNL